MSQEKKRQILKCSLLKLWLSFVSSVIYLFILPLK